MEQDRDSGGPDPLEGLYGRLICEEGSDIAEHLPRLRDLVVETDAQTVVEIGVGSGRSTTALLLGCGETGGRLWSVDVKDWGHYGGLGLSPRWTFVLSDSLAAVSECPRPIDLLFIDSAHDYEQTIAELRAYVPLVRPGGVVVMHDTTSWPDDIPRAIREYWPEGTIDEEWLTNCNGLFIGWL